MYESSIYKSPMDPSRFRLTFDLRIFEGTIQFENISLLEQSNILLNILDVQVNAKSNYTSLKKTIGQVNTSLWVFNQTSSFKTWDWIFDSNDISLIESARVGDISFEIEVKAIIEIRENGKLVIPIVGRNQVRFSESDWIVFLKYFGYSTKHGSSLSPTLLSDKSWLQAYKLLEEARVHMQQGKTYDALRQCLSTIESYMDSDKQSGPYNNKVWEELLRDITPQKKEGIAGLLGGVSTYLNKVGHHRNSKMKENGNLTPIPLDQYEVELLLSISQLVVTYLEKLRVEARS
jgi:hypothetical protein